MGDRKSYELPGDLPNRTWDVCPHLSDRWTDDIDELEQKADNPFAVPASLASTTATQHQIYMLPRPTQKYKIDARGSTFINVEGNYIVNEVIYGMRSDYEHKIILKSAFIKRKQLSQRRNLYMYHRAHSALYSLDKKDISSNLESTLNQTLASLGKGKGDVFFYMGWVV